MNKSYKAVLFDLDGTLLPMDQGVFTKKYFGELCRILAPTGLITPEKTVEAIWYGTKCMVKNDGSKPNVEVFWENFSDFTSIVGDNLEMIRNMCDGFYTKEFHRAKDACGENPLAKKAVELANCAGKRKVVLASNPVFPRVGHLSRISWVGLSESDFELVTAYENQRFCKPNPEYYLEICRTIGVSPSECLMVGNDEREDAKASSEAGMDCFLVTDCLIPCPDFHWEGKRGSFAQMVEYLESIQ